MNEAFASRYWPGLDPIGRRLDQGAGWATVVWSSLEQWPAQSFTLLFRVEGSLVEPLGRALASVHADLPLFEPRTLEEHMAAASFVHFVGASMLGAFGSLALVLSAVGIFGVLSYTVSLNRREIAIAIALGATSRRVVTDVLGRGMRLVVLGIAIGGTTAFFLGRLVASRLFEVSPEDPWTYVVTTALITVVALAALAHLHSRHHPETQVLLCCDHGLNCSCKNARTPVSGVDLERAARTGTTSLPGAALTHSRRAADGVSGA